MQTGKIIDHIVNWLKDYSRNARTSGFVVGVSGGIDSAVTSKLGALSGLDLFCVEMPIHQARAQVKRAQDHIEWMKKDHANVSMEVVELTPVFDRFIASLPSVDIGAKHEMALVNTRARLRMTTLYYFAAQRGYLVLGTGNKIEDFGVGFFTKYGDGGVDLSPIADLTKSEVYEVGYKLGIIDSILQAKPTDGLWGDDRTDEDQIGASYPELEWAMEVRTGNIDPTGATDRQKEVLAIYDRLNAANQHKMVPIPVCEIPPELR
jgi:NAD+ synthase